MSNNEPITKEQKPQGSLRSYLIGFILSLLLTFAAYIPVVMHQNSQHEFLAHEFLIPFVIILAFVQLVVQLLFFLHMGQESKPRWNLGIFLSTIGIVFIVIIGSIWIMTHLNYNMTPQTMNKYIIHDEGIQK
jgi:cytochrome o ubiquinol oxidase operon protein cyoD